MKNFKTQKNILLRILFITCICNFVTAQNQFSSDLNDYVFDLSSLFPNDEAFDEARLKVLTQLTDLESIKNKDLSKKDNLINALNIMYNVRMLVSKMSRYGFMIEVIHNDQKTNSIKGIGLEMESKVEGEIAFIEEAIRSIEPKKLRQWIKEDQEIANHKRRINKILWKAPHTLPSNEQKIIEQINEWTKRPVDIYLSLLNSDLGWSTIKLGDTLDVIANYENFNKYRRHEDPIVRQKVLKNYFAQLGNHQNTFGKIITNRIGNENIIANLRGFENGMDALWYLRDGMPIGSYNPMISSINKNLEAINRYINLKKKLLNKNDLSFYDLYAPLSKVTKEIKIDEALNISVEASKPLGKEYQELLIAKINSNLMHLAPTKGKDKYYYGISQPIGDANPYVIMTYRNNIASAESLMGAVTAMMKSVIIPLDKRPDTGDDSGIYGNSTIYVGTSLFSDYLYKKSDSREERIMILSTAIERIWSRVFRYVLVTEWEKEISDRISRGNIPSGENLSTMYMNLLEKYYKTIEIPSEAASEWMTFRVPFYSYEHQFWPAAMAGACTIMNRLQDGDKQALNIMRVLGNTEMDMTHSLYKELGIDMTTEQPYLEIIKRMNYLMDLLEKELN